MSAIDPWSATYDTRPTNTLCDREIEVCVVAQRCIYVNDYRVAGGKPYVSENLSSFTKKTTVRDVLNAFSDAEITAYLAEKSDRNSYLAGARNYRDALARSQEAAAAKGGE